MSEFVDSDLGQKSVASGFISKKLEKNEGRRFGDNELHASHTLKKIL